MALTVGENTYVTIATADEILKGFLNTEAWDNATDATKEKALRQMCGYMESFNYIGVKTNSTQTLQFPRTFYKNGHVKDMGIPSDIMIGQTLLALTALQPNMSNKTGIKSESVDGVGTVTYTEALSDQVIFKKAFDYIGKYIEKAVDLV